VTNTTNALKKGFLPLLLVASDKPFCTCWENSLLEDEENLSAISSRVDTKIPNRLSSGVFQGEKKFSQTSEVRVHGI